MYPLHKSPEITSLLQQMNALGEKWQAIAKTLQPVAGALVQIALELQHEFSKYDYAHDVLSKAGWVPHYTTPFDSIAQWNRDSKAISTKLLDHYTNNWSMIRKAMESRLCHYDIDPESKETFQEALNAHEAKYYRCVTRVLFPEIERLLRIEMEITGHLSSRKMIQRLVRRESGLSQQASLLDFAPNGLFELALFDRIVRVLRDGEVNSDALPYSGIYDSTEGSEEALASIRRDHVPNRHAALHGLVVYSSQQNSLNALFVTDYVFQVIDCLKGRREGAPPSMRTSGISEGDHS